MGVQDVYHETEKSFANGTNDREAHPKRWIAVLVQMNCEKKTATQLGKAGYDNKKYINGAIERKKSIVLLCQWSCLFVQL